MNQRSELLPPRRRFARALVGLGVAALAACGPGSRPTVAGDPCNAYDSSGSLVGGCFPVSCNGGFKMPACTTDADCGLGARCVSFQYFSSKGKQTDARCMKKCTTDADCGRPGLLACDAGYHVCSDFQGLFLSTYGTLGGHAAGGERCSSGNPPRRSDLFSKNVATSDSKNHYAAEVSMAIDPTTSPPTIYAAYNQGAWVGGVFESGSEIVRSDDGGATWKTLTFRDGSNIGDPALAVDQKTGELYYAYIGGVGLCRAGDTFYDGNEIHLVFSTDHGDTFQGPVTVNTGAYADSHGMFMDKPQAVVGPQGDVYVTFDAAPVTVDPVAPSDIVLARSTDHGKTFTDVRVDRAHAVGRNLAQPAVDEAGDLWVTWQEPAVVGATSAARGGHIRIAKSVDRGHLFGPSEVVDPGDEAADWPNAITVSPDGKKVYVAYQSRTPGKIDVFDVKVAYSLDGGATWQQPVKVNDDATCATHWLPGIGLGPAGDVWSIWYDNRYGGERVFGAEGTLTGQTLSFGKSFEVTDGDEGPFSTGRGYGTISDYLGFATSGSLAVAGWADLRDEGIDYSTRVFTSVATLPR